MRKMRTFSPFLMSFLLVGCGADSQWRAIRENREGIKALKAENPGGAADRFVGALAEEPFFGALHHNLALSFDLQKKGDEAVASYRNAEKYAIDDTTRFLARFNLGEALGRAKKVDDALEWYQKALEVKPDSVEAKTNIELLLAGGGGQGGSGQDQQQQQQDQKNESDKKDSKGGQDQKDPKDAKDPKDPNNQNDGKEKKPDDKREYKQSPKYQPRPYKGDLNEGEVKKILGEIRQQEQRIRSEFNRRDVKERPRDKDW